MCLSSSQIEANKGGVRLRPCTVRCVCGFTLVELITVILILGIISVVVLPRFFDRSTFDSRGFHDQLISTIRYAQKAAIAKRRFVCVAITSANVSLTYGTTSACTGGSLPIPPGKTSISVPGGVTVTAASFGFDALGSPVPNTAQSISVGGVATPITVEAETGYVH